MNFMLYGADYVKTGFFENRVLLIPDYAGAPCYFVIVLGHDVLRQAQISGKFGYSEPAAIFARRRRPTHERSAGKRGTIRPHKKAIRHDRYQKMETRC